jgi:hypothetical protein
MIDINSHTANVRPVVLSDFKPEHAKIFHQNGIRQKKKR